MGSMAWASCNQPATCGRLDKLVGRWRSSYGTLTFQVLSAQLQRILYNFGSFDDFSISMSESTTLWLQQPSPASIFDSSTAASLRELMASYEAFSFKGRCISLFSSGAIFSKQSKARFRHFVMIPVDTQFGVLEHSKTLLRHHFRFLL